MIDNYIRTVCDETVWRHATLQHARKLRVTVAADCDVIHSLPWRHTARQRPKQTAYDEW